jgi:hypothetical protein
LSAATTGNYSNNLYGGISISQADKKLVIAFQNHPNLVGTLDYMDKDEWLLQFNNIEFGVFAIHFNIDNGKVVSVPIKVNDFIEFDPYVFQKF